MGIEEGDVMSKEKHSFWYRPFFDGPYPDERKQIILGYVVCRTGEGAHLAEAIYEECVQRNASPDETAGTFWRRACSRRGGKGLFVWDACSNTILKRCLVDESGYETFKTSTCGELHSPGPCHNPSANA